MKRLLAYSSIAHTGYILVGLAAYRLAADRRRHALGGLAEELTYNLYW